MNCILDKRLRGGHTTLKFHSLVDFPCFQAHVNNLADSVVEYGNRAVCRYLACHLISPLHLIEPPPFGHPSNAEGITREAKMQMSAR